ncbi:MAG: DUF421 domain-containing protein [Flavobacteriaceae bacterium]|nr:DUF421 domain-containing protein [Flavobacteriaceae bacterium]
MDIHWNQLLELTFNSSFLIVASALGVYVVVITLTRIFGKRSFSKMSSFDFAMTVAVGSVIATIILNQEVSLLEGFVSLLCIYLLQLGAAYGRRLTWFRKAIDNKPLLLMDQNGLLNHNLKKARVTETDLKSKLREANVMHLWQVKAVVFETTGTVSIMFNDEKEDKPDKWIIDNVKV